MGIYQSSQKAVKQKALTISLKGFVHSQMIYISSAGISKQHQGLHHQMLHSHIRPEAKSAIYLPFM